MIKLAHLLVGVKKAHCRILYILYLYTVFGNFRRMVVQFFWQFPDSP